MVNDQTKRKSEMGDMKRTIHSVTLLGSSSGRNAGDAAIMSGVMDSVDAAVGSRLLYEIPTIKPEFVRNNYQNDVRPVSMLPWNFSVKMLGLPTYRSVMRTDLSLVFDAVLFDRSLYNCGAPMLGAYIFIIVISSS